ncbi:MAG: hypothetical protein HDR37_12160 [Treponema sp.]|nr:hypothetical protein [Treponema sp.]
MKKFAKLAAVLAALMLALSCFVACSSGDDDDDDDGGPSVLEGYWATGSAIKDGYYFVGNKMYRVNAGYYYESQGIEFSISGDTVKLEGKDYFSFSISEDGETLTTESNGFKNTYKKQSGEPLKK